MLMEHFLCDDVGGKHNVCGMVINYDNSECLRFSLKTITRNLTIFNSNIILYYLKKFE